MENTSGFYKETEDGWFHAPHFVEAPDYILISDNKDEYVYPIDEWVWYDEAPKEFVK